MDHIKIKEKHHMQLVDRVLDKSSDKIIALKNITINEPCFKDHIIDNEPVLPGSIILEIVGQIGDILLETVTYLAKVDNMRFYEKVIPGDQLIIEVNLLRSIGKIHKLYGIGKVEDKRCVEVNFTVREDG
jgi:3-hydroxyacyl-[acyl-carrier-protein] dehydratase|tara:strand:+ start:1831 stop:2220 length:390 start_codon:yes stop_codon:yes gene_type:complete